MELRERILVYWASFHRNWWETSDHRRPSCCPLFVGDDAIRGSKTKALGVASNFETKAIETVSGFRPKVAVFG